jgi:ribonuclease P protein component
VGSLSDFAVFPLDPVDSVIAIQSTRPMKSQQFSRSRRIRRRSEFQQAFAIATRVHVKSMTVLVAPNRAGTVRLGIVASRKLGDAVRRNRAKRLIREMFRRIVPSSSGDGLDIVIIPRRELLDAPYTALEREFRTALRRCGTRRSSHAG